jgi:hypothetical protein
MVVAEEPADRLSCVTADTLAAESVSTSPPAMQAGHFLGNRHHLQSRPDHEIEVNSASVPPDALRLAQTRNLPRIGFHSARRQVQHIHIAIIQHESNMH